MAKNKNKKVNQDVEFATETTSVPNKKQQQTTSESENK